MREGEEQRFPFRIMKHEGRQRRFCAQNLSQMLILSCFILTWAERIPPLAWEPPPGAVSTVKERVWVARPGGPGVVPSLIVRRKASRILKRSQAKVCDSGSFQPLPIRIRNPWPEPPAATEIGAHVFWPKGKWCHSILPKFEQFVLDTIDRWWMTGR